MSIRFVVLRLFVLFTTISSIEQPAALAQPAAANPVVTATGSLSKNRHNHTATLLLNGKVLVVGGGGWPCSGRLCYSSVNDTAELYDLATGTWRLTGNLSRRGYHSATLLPNGQVLVVGGVNYGFDIGRYENLDSAELYDPVIEVWRSTPRLNAVHGPNNAVLLPNGKVLVVGSEAAELFDTSTETWSLTRAPSKFGPLVLLPAGKVLTASAGSTELYDPATETWSSAGNFNVISAISTLTLLRNGQVLATGSVGGWRETAAELYDPAARTWRVTAGPKSRRQVGTATLLPNGQVLFAGGYDPQGQWPEGTLHSMELFDPLTEAWTMMPSLLTRRVFHTATVLPDDKVLFVAGIDGDFDIGTVWHSSAELFDLRLPRPTSLSVSPRTVSRGQCFTMAVGNGQGMTLDIQYRLDGGPVQTLTRWPKLDEDGRAENICTSVQTPIGTFEFIAIRNTETTYWVPISTYWVPISTSVTVTAAP